MGPFDVVVDQFSALSHKPLIGQPGRTRPRSMAPTWVPEAELRRLNAYIVRAAYLSNSARQLIDSDERDERREYGDVGLLVDRIAGGVLGDWTLSVDGADADHTESQLPERPEPSAPEAGPLEQRLAALRLAEWERDAEALLAQWEAEAETQPIARERERDLREWAERAQLAERFDDAEHKALGLGDSVMVLWPQTGSWPTVTVFEPGFYFPQLSDADLEDFPSVVHIAWEFETRDRDGRLSRFVRRLTWELVDIAGSRIGTGRGGEPIWVGPDGLATLNPLKPGEAYDETTQTIQRPTPWGDRASSTCLFSDGVWPLDKLGGKIDALDDTQATWLARRADLGVDFIPVVHLPGTAAGGEHYGRSVVDLVAQVADDISAADTSAMTASQYLGKPVISLSGASVPKEAQVVPGMMFGVGERGSMDVLDLSAGLEQLLKHGDRLLDRFWVNGRVPREVIGRVDATNAPSGLALLLSFGPFGQVVGSTRMTHGPKIELLLKMAQRLAMTYQAIKPGPIPRARINFGPYLPTNRTETVSIVTDALNAGALSVQTAVAMLVAAGLPIDDARAEVDRIRADDTEAAKNVADATGSELLAADRLGLKLPGGVPAPEIVLPPVDLDA